MLIEVTEEDITYGIPMSASLCPIARAFARKGIEVAVGSRRLYVVGKHPDFYSCFVEMPEGVITWRMQFDHNSLYEYEPSKPFSFEWNEVRNEFY